HGLPDRQGLGPSGGRSGAAHDGLRRLAGDGADDLHPRAFAGPAALAGIALGGVGCLRRGARLEEVERTLTSPPSFLQAFRNRQAPAASHGFALVPRQDCDAPSFVAVPCLVTLPRRTLPPRCGRCRFSASSSSPPSRAWPWRGRDRSSTPSAVWG